MADAAGANMMLTFRMLIHADRYMVMRLLMMLPCMMRNIMIILAIVMLFKMKMMTMNQGVQMCTIAVKSG